MPRYPKKIAASKKSAMEGQGLSSSMAVLFAIAAGLAIGNLYWAQPLLAQIAEGFGVAPVQGGLLLTATQIGYAIGVLLIVPLGDMLHRRKLIATTMVLSLIMLVDCSFAPSFAFLAVALSGLGLTTVAGQIILPLAGDLASPSERGRMVGIVTSGITTGILLSRFASGIIADALDWRAVYVIAALLNSIIVIVLALKIPETPKREQVPYRKLIAGVFSALRRYLVLPPILLANGLVFGIAFNLFWTALTFLLAGEPFHFNTFQIGLVSLAGVTGAFAAVGCGRLQDAGYGVPALGAAIALCILSMVGAVLGSESIVSLVVVAAIFSLAIQGVCILNQTRIFALSNTERSRLNTAFVVNNFLFSAAGSGLATAFWNLGGWTAVALSAAVFCLIAFAIWLFSRKKFAMSLTD